LPWTVDLSISTSQIYRVTSLRHCTQTLSFLRMFHFSWVPVTYACTPSYSGGRDQEDRSSKLAQANSLQDPILKSLSQKNSAGGVAQGERPEFKPQCCTHTHTHTHTHTLLLLRSTFLRNQSRSRLENIL
jgi:hypothetical protein